MEKRNQELIKYTTASKTEEVKIEKKPRKKWNQKE